MNPPLLLETLAADHQRELVDEAGRERITALVVGRGGPSTVATLLRRLAVALVTSRGSEEEFSPQMAIVHHA